MQQNMMGQNIIITEPSKSLRALGRNALAGKWKIAVLAVIVYQLCIEIPSVILNSLFGTKVDIYGVQMDYNYNVDVYSDIYNSMPTYSTLSGIYLILVSGAFAL